MSPQYLRQCFDADPDTGRLFWKDRPRDHFVSAVAAAKFNAAWAGKQAGYRNRIGYVVVSVRRGGVQKKLLAHRVLWAVVHGAWPTQVIDHINHDRADNRLCNLRDVPPDVNAANRRKSSALRQPATGVRHSGSKFVAYIGGGGRQRYLGSFGSLSDAVAARIAAKREAA